MNRHPHCPIAPGGGNGVKGFGRRELPHRGCAERGHPLHCVGGVVVG